MIDLITKGMQSFEINAYLLLTITLIVRTLSRLIYKTAFFGQILCDSKEYLGNIGVSNDTKRKEIKKMTIGISTF